MAEFGTALDETPSNLNYLSPLIYKFQIKKTPTVNFFVQNINLPGLHLANIDVNNQFVRVPKGGDHIDYDELMINFKVDETLTNWLEIHNWIRGMGFPESFSEYSALNNQPQATGLGLYSDASLVICNSQRIPKFNVIFEDAFPISLSSIIFDNTQSNETYLTAAATFKYTKYDIETII